ncbi:MAG: metallophosphoesterase [Melioribacteraceae bacterium]|nr:metallophosphoesterase [Melioribacteraceae bacterium]MCO6474466.1 metallophosphoesterase [Melioribacteraceae bacterium]
MIAVIGDIHGCFYTLEKLYKKIVKKYKNISVYTVGDLVDRGNFSFEVVNFIIENNIKFTPGNHDYMFYHFFRDPESVFAKSWMFNGNEATLLSYESNGDAIFRHIDHIKSQPLYYDLDECFISHAGISYHYAKILNENIENNVNILSDYIYADHATDKGVLWTRDPLLDIGKIQVVGHTKHQKITYDEDSHSVYIDTGACVGNRLSAVIVDANNIVDTIDEKTHLDDIF